MKKKFLQITDIHIDENCNKNVLALQNIISHILTHNADTLFALVTGDNSDTGTYRSYEILKGEFEKLPFPLYFLPGNHDDSVQMKNLLNVKNLSCPDQIINDNFQILLLDTSVKGKESGFLSGESLKRIDQFLASSVSKNMIKIIAMHHPPILTGSKFFDKMRLLNLDEMIKRLDAYKGESKIWVLAGHIHQERSIKSDKYEILTSPAVSRQFNFTETSYSVDDTKHSYKEFFFDQSSSPQTNVVTLEL